jgi:ABC-type branched-subunit amino acid transport system substrate-binding protein
MRKTRQALLVATTVAVMSLMLTMVSGAATHAAPNAKSPLNVMILEGGAIPGLGNQQAGPVAAADYINAHGGVDGHMIDATYCSGGAGLFGDPNSTATCASQAVSNHDLAMVGTITGFEQNVYPAIDAAKIPNFVGVATNPALDNVNPMSFQVFPDSFSSYAGQGIQLGMSKCTKSALVATQGTPELSAYEMAFNAGVRYTGHKAAAPIEVASTVTDYAPTVALLESAGDTCASFSVTGGSLAAFLTAIKDSGQNLKVIVNETALGAQVLAALGPLANGVLANGLLLPQELHTKDQKFLNSTIAKYQPGTPVTPFPWPQEEEMFYFGQLAKAVYAAHLPMTSKNIIKEIPKIVLNYGITPPISFAKPGPIKGAPKVYDVESYQEIVKNQTLVTVTKTPINPTAAIKKYHLTE